jgi:hypothetical protein
VGALDIYLHNFLGNVISSLAFGYNILDFLFLLIGGLPNPTPTL